jgi:hypothetical protein
MAETQSLKEAVAQRGPYAVWDLMSEDEQREAAKALWESADGRSRSGVEQALAKELKFRPQSVRKLPFERVATRMLRLADDQPDAVLFQFLLHLHLGARRELLVEYLDAIGLPHKEGILDLPDDAKAPDVATVEAQGRDLLKAHGQRALVYLATLKVADSDFWSGVDPLLEDYAADGSELKKEKKKAKTKEEDS